MYPFADINHGSSLSGFDGERTTNIILGVYVLNYAGIEVSTNLNDGKIINMLS